MTYVDVSGRCGAHRIAAQGFGAGAEPGAAEE